MTFGHTAGTFSAVIRKVSEVTRTVTGMHDDEATVQGVFREAEALGLDPWRLLLTRMGAINEVA